MPRLPFLSPHPLANFHLFSSLPVTSVPLDPINLSPTIKKEEEVPEISLPDTDPAVLEDMVEAKSLLSTAIEAYCTIVVGDFTDLLEIVEEEHGRDLGDKLEAVISNLPYNELSV